MLMTGSLFRGRAAASIFVFSFIVGACETLSLCAADIAPAATPTGLKPPERVPEPKLLAASDEPVKAMAKFRIAPGFKVNVWAAEPMLANPVAFCVDEKGVIYTAETYRYRTSALDIRHYMFMLEDDLASRSTNDRIAYIKKNFPNDWQKLGVETEVVRRLEDSNGDGKADQSTVYADDMRSLLDGINSGVLAFEGNVWCTNIPNLLLFSGLTQDGRAARRAVVSSGYGVRFSFTGHDLHGLIIGPDGRLYFSFGDRGANVKTNEGTTLAFPDEGAVFRCELDGSHLEVVHRGLRNPQELAFDDHGNLFTGDNDSDQGDRERWVYLVEGGDSGWRVGWQHNPLGKDYNPWLAEQMWEPRAQDKNQPAYILSPILNIPDGPSGIVHYPGTGLPAEFRGHFFVCGFKGTSARSAITHLKVREQGAGFAVENAPAQFVGDVQATDIDFGPDSRIYFSEWGEGWEGTGRGRIFRMEHTPSQTAQAAQIGEVKTLLAEGFAARPVAELARLLGHADQRIRLRAQWALAKRVEGLEELRQAASKKENPPLARLHGIWGVAQAARANDQALSAKAVAARESLRPLLKDADAEVRAQVAHAAREIDFPTEKTAATAWKSDLLPLLRDPSGRVRFFAAQTLGKIGGSDVANGVIAMLRENNGADEYLRHAGVLALASLGEQASAAAAKHQSAEVRMGALLAMRRNASPAIAQFLHDSEPRLVREAAIAINDLPISNATADLAKLADDFHALDVQTMLRAINANFRAGTAECATRLARVAANEGAPRIARLEALNALGTWPTPFSRDRIAGLHRPMSARDAAPAVAAFRPVLPQILRAKMAAPMTGAPGQKPRATKPDDDSRAERKPPPPETAGGSTATSDPNGDVLVAAIETVRALAMKDAAPVLSQLLSQPDAPAKARSKALETLAALDAPNLKEAIATALTATNPSVRVTASTLLGKVEPERAAQQLVAAYPDAELPEKKAILLALGGLESVSADKALITFLDDLRAGGIAPPLQLELIEAAARRKTPDVAARLAAYENSLPTNDPLARFRVALAGGDRDAGEKLFKEHAVAQCFRCHRVKGTGGEAGPDLTGIGARKDRSYILESIVAPNAQIAEGFQSILVTLKNGEMQLGIVKKEDADALTLQAPAPDAPPVTVKKSEIKARENGPSGMPPGLGELLTKRELRDLVEYVASLTEK
jgi:quinoprotein glucose dehydrogenase